MNLIWRSASSCQKKKKKSEENKLFLLNKVGTAKSRSYSSKITLLQQIGGLNAIQKQLSPILYSSVTGIKDMRKNEVEITLSF